MNKFHLIPILAVCFLAACTNTSTASPETIVAAVRSCAPFGGLKEFGVAQEYTDRSVRIEAVCVNNETHVLTTVERPVAIQGSRSAPASAASQ